MSLLGPSFPQRGSQLFWLPGLAETDVTEETRPAGLSPVGFVSGVSVAAEWRQGAMLSSSLLLSCSAATLREGKDVWGVGAACRQRWSCSVSPISPHVGELGQRRPSGKGEKAQHCFHLARCKSFLTSSEELHYTVAGGWLSAQGIAGDLVSACPENPNILRLLGCCRGQWPFSTAKQSAPESNKAPGLVSGSIKLSCMAKTTSL